MSSREIKKSFENLPGEPRPPEREPLPEFSGEEIEDMLEGFENETETEALLAQLSDAQIDKIIGGWENADKRVAEKLRGEKKLSNRDILRLFFLASSEKRSVRKITPGTVGIAAFPRYVKKKYPDLFKEETATPETQIPLSKEGRSEYEKSYHPTQDIPETRKMKKAA